MMPSWFTQWDQDKCGTEQLMCIFPFTFASCCGPCYYIHSLPHEIGQTKNSAANAFYNTSQHDAKGRGRIGGRECLGSDESHSDDITSSFKQTSILKRYSFASQKKLNLDTVKAFGQHFWNFAHDSNKRGTVWSISADIKSMQYVL